VRFCACASRYCVCVCVCVCSGEHGVLAIKCPPIRSKDQLDCLLNEEFLDACTRVPAHDMCVQLCVYSVLVAAAFLTDLDFCLWRPMPANVVNVTGAGICVR